MPFTQNGNVRFHLSRLVFWWKSFLVNEGIDCRLWHSIEQNQNERPIFLFEFPFLPKPINWSRHTAHNSLPWEENFYQYLTFHFRTNDFIIIFLACSFSGLNSLTVCYLQAHKNHERAKNERKFPKTTQDWNIWLEGNVRSNPYWWN